MTKNKVVPTGPQMPFAAIRLAVATVLLALFLRTWLVMGLIAPVSVAGSSMAPACRGPFVEPQCPNCQTTFPVGVEFAENTPYAACPQCAEARVPLEGLPVARGDRLWIDRATLRWRPLRRWELAVFRQPDNGNQLCLKRVVALPGENVRLAEGDVWVDGALAVKPLGEQLSMSQLVYRCDGSNQRWTSQQPGAWLWTEGAWQFASEARGDPSWLRYVHPDSRPVTDDVTYNAGLSRPLNLVRDFLLSAKLRTAGAGTLAVELDDGNCKYLFTVCPSEGTLRLREAGKPMSSGMLAESNCRRLRQGEVQLVVSNFDRQLLLAVDGRVELQHRLAEQLPIAGTAVPFSIGAEGLRVSLAELTVYRDVYYSPAPVGTRPAAEAFTLLESDQYFVLGDNPPISVDSRSWGPVTGRLLLGRPIDGR